MRSEILALLDNTLTVNYEYSRNNRQNLQLPIQIKLFEKPSTFSNIFLQFLESKLSLQYSEKKKKKKKNIVGQLFNKLLTPKDELL